MHLCDTLLNYYVDHKHLEKAEAMMQTMKELGLAKALSYNWMLSLYSKIGKYEDVHILMQEMEDKGSFFQY
jgi:pentatricopeptide repeat protein